MKCRFCNAGLRHKFLSLGASPLSNSFLKEEDLDRAEPFYPLNIYVCDKCFLVQVEEFEAPEKIFSADYAYYSSYSHTWLEHCREYAENIIKRLNLGRDSLVVEIAANDGCLLQYFKRHKIPVLGIEPAANTAKEAMKKGLPMEIAFFDEAFARKMKKKKMRADLVIGNNVLAHNPDLNGFVESLGIILKEDGVITMEFPHLLKMIDGNQFDTIYHEHFSYFSLHAVRDIFLSHGLFIFDVEEIPTHGGSLRVYAKHKADGSKPLSGRVGRLLERERSAGLLDMKIYSNFAEKVYATKRRLLQLLIRAKDEDRRIVAYGAPAKGNTLLNYCGIGTDFIDYTVDLNPYKQGKFLPGSHIYVKEPGMIKRDKPDYVLILPWNIKDEIMRQLSFIRAWGGRFIIPIPEAKVI